MNWILYIPLDVRLIALFVLGACVGSLINWAAYRLAWNRRAIGPWTSPPAKAPPRHWADRLPIFGWLGLRREVNLHGAGFWVRPLLVELLIAVGWAVLYWWEIEQQGLLADAPHFDAIGIQAILHAQYLAHAVLISMIVAVSLIDVDERTIPDAITVPGTLLGLLLAFAFPWSMLPDLVAPFGDADRAVYWALVTPETWEIMHPLSPESPPDWILPVNLRRVWEPQGVRAFSQPWLLGVALGCWWLWCIGLMPRPWHPRHGIRRAFALCLARVRRERATYWLLLLGLLGSLGILGAWNNGGPRWTGLLSALVGMAVGGGLIWAVRIIGMAVLRREAMGFGDVTLMAMIGAFLGWQACLFVFFLAPFAAIGIGLVQWIVFRENRIPYGPFLGLAAAIVIVYWAAIWDEAWEKFDFPWLVPGAMLGVLVLMPVALGIVQLAKRPFR